MKVPETIFWSWSLPGAATADTLLTPTRLGGAGPDRVRGVSASSPLLGRGGGDTQPWTSVPGPGDAVTQTRKETPWCQGTSEPAVSWREGSTL